MRCHGVVREVLVFCLHQEMLRGHLDRLARMGTDKNTINLQSLGKGWGSKCSQNPGIAKIGLVHLKMDKDLACQNEHKEKNVLGLHGAGDRLLLTDHLFQFANNDFQIPINSNFMDQLRTKLRRKLDIKIRKSNEITY